ncbi:hypothetical protein F511_46526 [Dorcoceras hygrometricum]|uniref:Uncharacterized protein n=1 Tax=Dorcoceras hygrometricum TaxID=472368 RepID=A0A2Z6ZTU0_9LAMI|nr:hypothetical protein F511_46526 [Dorcoceras hygrometricum]
MHARAIPCALAAHARWPRMVANRLLLCRTWLRNEGPTDACWMRHSRVQLARLCAMHGARWLLEDAALVAAACGHAPHAMLAAAAVRRIFGSDATAIFL